ncbi:MAG: hypothetical protein CVT59_10200 [Actinobacteria bacterium HGW-Actinobacteria-1]|jgi:hypothetical protein|nr:MAG: hypothetical protein CVT59_10200 [Actinobacteria bacterium HGW-Actinobacteria-1]
MVLLVLAKVLISPLLLATSTFAVHRWGPLVGGLMIGLPLVSGPISILLFAQYGQSFAVHAAYGTLLGFVAAGAFCTSYSVVSQSRPWWQSLMVAYAVFFVTAGVLSLIHVTLGWVFTLVAVALATLAFTIVVPRRAPAVPAPRKRVIAARMVLAASMVLLITSTARLLGPELSGFLAPLPVLAAIMAASSQRQSGSAAVHGLLRGAIFGSWGGAAFFSVVILLAGQVDASVMYATAAVMAIMTELVAMKLQSPDTDETCPAAPSIHMPAEAMASMPHSIR